MSLPGKMRSLKVHLNEQEFLTPQIATTVSPYEAQSEFLAAIILPAAQDVIAQFRD